jgi:hypothetical protein
MSKINHYDVLGVPRDCDQSLIDTVYKSMVKIFHPDVFKGDKAFAQDKLKVINEAYGVLGNVERRKSYDAGLKRSEGSGATEEVYEDENPNHQPFDEMYSDEWSVVIEYFPEIDNLFKSLTRLNLNLSAAFRVNLITTKKYREANILFQKMKFEFLRTKFGENWSIHSLVLAAIETGNKNFALELNRDLVILGEEEYSVILVRLRQKYKAFCEEYYPKFGFGSFVNANNAFEISPGVYVTQSAKVFEITLNHSALMPCYSATRFNSLDELVRWGALTSAEVRTAKKIS